MENSNLTRRSFVKKSSYSAAAVTVLGTGVALATSPSGEEKPEQRVYRKLLYIKGVDQNGKYTYTSDANQAFVFGNDTAPDKDLVTSPTGVPPQAPSWNGVMVESTSEAIDDIQTEPLKGGFPEMSSKIGHRTSGSQVNGYKKQVEMIVTYKWEYGNDDEQ